MEPIVRADHGDWPQRQLILLDGERERGLQTAAELIAKRQPERLVWVSNAPIPDRISEVISAGICRPESRPISRPASKPISKPLPQPFSRASKSATHSFIAEAIPPAKVQRLLGGECDLLVMDLWTGLDADAIGAAVGSLRGGGLLLLLTPELSDWPSWVDPEAARIAVHPFSAAEVGTRFIARLARLLQAFAAVERPERLEGLEPKGGVDARQAEDRFRLQHLTTDQPSAALTPVSSATRSAAGGEGTHDPVSRMEPSGQSIGQSAGQSAGRSAGRSESRLAGLFTDRSAGQSKTATSATGPSAGRRSAEAEAFDADEQAEQARLTDARAEQACLAQDRARPATTDQAEAIAAICTLAAGRARRPLVLTADRGRGKSAALGIAAGRLIAQHRLQIIVSAPRRSAVDTLFEHAHAAFKQTNTTQALESAAELEHLLRFQAPDTVLATTPTADLLLIDEAAGIPAPLLEPLLMHYRRICFATTVHGYEGSGRGFEIRFRALLDQRTPGWQALRLRTPIRWSQGDSVEQLLNRLLLLDAEPASDAQVADADLTAVQFVLHDRDALAANEPLLRQLFGLLLLGHYQTRPNDLRHLLDGPNLSVASLCVDGLVLATALIAREGWLEPALIQPIFEGRRRPRGHLLPQTLSAHAGLREAPRLGYARIVRIAVHPAARRRGLGRRLIEAVAARTRQDGLDVFGPCFGASTELLSFWHHCGLAPLHLGTRHNAASGARAVVVLKP
ncbi:MAG: GNAT family N-acetyltransferase, partial [Chromatiaceae bacterium]|nr:GNAT family N-acetyltransferase [Chromatiaceae bacterium]